VNCKYNGGNNTVPTIKQMYEEGRCIAVCPEQLGGLSTPRPSAEIIEEHVINTEGTDVSREYEAGALAALKQALQAGCKEAVLKAYSPSCGCGEIYDGTFTHTKVKGNGIFAGLCIKNGIHCITDVEYKEKKR
jgi:uncharacterized protein YbbK (DUF523 family)